MPNSIVLFNNDLRVKDNLALINACKDAKVLPVFILDENIYYAGCAGKVWLYKALEDLNKSLNGNLLFFKGDTKTILNDILNQVDIDNIFWNRLYEPKAMQYFAQLKQDLSDKYFVKSFNSSLLIEPSKLLKKDQTFYKVYTPFSKQVLNTTFRAVEDAPLLIEYTKHNLKALSLDELNLLPTDKTWHLDLIKQINATQQGAHKALSTFIENNLVKYKTARDVPNLDATSRLSAYLHFGQISPNQIIQEVEKHKSLTNEEGLVCFVSEVIWREFSYYLLYHFNDLDKTNFNAKFNNFKWDNNPELLKKWQQGKTGIPIVDAGLRQLYQTGYMHNRVRMIVASFLIKNLLVDWREGAKWFQDTLFDADLASNSASWQWVAGSGADAAPYFRIFNPILQSEKFDKQGEYIKKYVPELKDLPAKYIHQPNLMTAEIAKLHNFDINTDYCQPIVDLKQTREAALLAYKQL